MKFQKNGKSSSGKRTRHFNITLFCITDLINIDENKVRYYYPMDEVIGNHMSKPLVGTKFKVFRDFILNLSDKHHHISQQ